MFPETASNNVHKKEDGESYVFQSYLANTILVLQQFQ